MAGIEKITGTTKAVTTTNEQGESVTVEVSYLVCVAHTHTHTHTDTHTRTLVCVNCCRSWCVIQQCVDCCVCVLIVVCLC